MTIHNDKMILNVNNTVSNAVDSQIILSYLQIFSITYIYIYIYIYIYNHIQSCTLKIQEKTYFL